MKYDIFESELGTILIAADEDELKYVSLQQGKGILAISPDWIKDTGCDIIKQAIKQLNEYFSGMRKTFDLKLNPAGTKFQRKVWAALLEIPYGKTVSYKEIAKKVGNQNAVRAVGTANGKNPIQIIIPCHRVIGINGDLIGYSGGIETKEALLNLEGVIT